jgi:hypothetical protein
MRSSLDESAPQVDCRPDWLPDDWLPGSTQRTSARPNTTSEHLQPQNPAAGLESYSGKIETIEEAEAAEQIPSALPDDELIIERNRDRAVKYA